MNQILMIVMAAGAVLGGADRILGNRFGLGEQFERGFQLLGPMALSMAGMICLTPVLADALGRVVVPVYRLMGVDPAMFGSLLAIDMGGYQLAKELAADPLAGSYAGLVVSAIFGCTLVFTIPVGMGMIPRADRGFFARGIMLGLAAMQKPEMVREASVQILEQFIHHFGKLFKSDTEYQLSKEELLTKDEFREDFMTRYPTSLLFETRLGHFIFCARRWEIKKKKGF